MSTVHWSVRIRGRYVTRVGTRVGVTRAEITSTRRPFIGPFEFENATSRAWVRVTWPGMGRRVFSVFGNDTSVRSIGLTRRTLIGPFEFENVTSRAWVRVTWRGRGRRVGRSLVEFELTAAWVRDVTGWRHSSRDTPPRDAFNPFNRDPWRW